MGSCDYASPCIIGSLLTEEDREYLADWLVVERETGSIMETLIIRPGEFKYPVGVLHESQLDIGRLIAEGAVTVPEDQITDVADIQEAFDQSDWETVVEIASKYMTHDAS